ncbi:hypothetical protein M407DRAFT_242800 [Tulasnella calospora MUT 4182]|uniref:Oxidized purine nucleoside triphosphate hydrolase n=1 Tax=Tulasnella calospora MUT 4182 TaxID=1051891 RepID=A0A0C3QM62_9AGAM|nr:hypothetical protein M407DRAFT_242800 [Tulasnella calospora MUT 4182]
MLVNLGVVEVDATEVTSGSANSGLSWSHIDKTQLYTNGFIFNENSTKVLLGLKKRGLGCGFYNGFGGKVNPGETPADAALRELQEEAGISSNLAHAGTLLFTSAADPKLHHIEIYRGDDWSGEITESEEMRPEWFRVPSYARSGVIPTSAIKEWSDVPGEDGLRTVPFGQMWADDRFWFHLLVAKRPFIGRVDFGEPLVKGDLNSAPLLKWWFGEVNGKGADG